VLDLYNTRWKVPKIKIYLRIELGNVITTLVTQNTNEPYTKSNVNVCKYCK